MLRPRQRVKFIIMTREQMHKLRALIVREIEYFSAVRDSASALQREQSIREDLWQQYELQINAPFGEMGDLAKCHELAEDTIAELVVQIENIDKNLTGI